MILTGTLIKHVFLLNFTYELLSFRSVYVCSLSGPGTTLNLKGCKINNAPGASAKSKKVRDISKGEGGGGFPEECPYDVSRGQNRFVTLSLTYKTIELINYVIVQVYAKIGT